MKEGTNNPAPDFPLSAFAAFNVEDDDDTVGKRGLATAEESLVFPSTPKAKDVLVVFISLVSAKPWLDIKELLFPGELVKVSLLLKLPKVRLVEDGSVTKPSPTSKWNLAFETPEDDGTDVEKELLLKSGPKIGFNGWDVMSDNKEDGARGELQEVCAVDELSPNPDPKLLSADDTDFDSPRKIIIHKKS